MWRDVEGRMDARRHDPLLRLQEEFRVRLEPRLMELDAELNGSCDARRVVAMFHSLEGIGGTFGFPAITEISKRCGKICANALGKGRGFTAEEKENLARAVLEIGAAGAQPSDAAWPHQD